MKTSASSIAGAPIGNIKNDTDIASPERAKAVSFEDYRTPERKTSIANAFPDRPNNGTTRSLCQRSYFACWHYSLV